MQKFWPSHSFTQLYPGLERNARGWLMPGLDYWRYFLAMPELAPVEQSCPSELALHAALLEQPLRAVKPERLLKVQDADARGSYKTFLRFRDQLLAAGTLEAWYLGLFPRSGSVRIDIAPLFIDLVLAAITRNVLDDSQDAFELRAAEMLFRSQRISTQDSQVLSGDALTLDMLSETGGVGDIGRFLAEAGAPMASVQMQVLSDDNAAEYWASSQGQRFLLDLKHEINNDLSHGLVLTLTRARSGLKSLAQVLQKWLLHMLGIHVSIRPLQKIDDASWRWHVGLDVQSTALLNDLYEGQEIEPARLQRLISLFKLDFADPREMRADVAGKPVYLGLMMDGQGLLRLKPQNLLINLPLLSVQ